MFKSKDMTPDQREDVEISVEDWEIILDMIVDMGFAEKNDAGLYRLRQGIKIVTDEEYHGE